MGSMYKIGFMEMGKIYNEMVLCGYCSNFIAQ